jgi:hypothetical protein
MRRYAKDNICWTRTIHNNASLQIPEEEEEEAEAEAAEEEEEEEATITLQNRASAPGGHNRVTSPIMHTVDVCMHVWIVCMHALHV